MGREEDVLTVVMEVGERIMLKAKGEGEPARVLTYSLVAGGAMVLTAIGYGAYKYGSQAYDKIRGKDLTSSEKK